MYEEPTLQVVLFYREDIVRMSGESDWYDDNVDKDGWT